MLCSWLVAAAADACERSINNDLYTNTCGCDFAYFDDTACDGSLLLTYTGLTVQGWPDSALAEDPRCYTRADYANYGASTSLWPASAQSVLVDCGEPLWSETKVTGLPPAR